MSIVGIAFVATLLAALLLNHSSISESSEFKSHAPTLVAFLKDSVDESEGRKLLSQIEKKWTDSCCGLHIQGRKSRSRRDRVPRFGDFD